MNVFSKKILVIDDSVENLNILKVILEKEQYDVFLSKDGTRGIQIAKEVKPDIILLDIMMPGIDGYETCTFLKEDKQTKDIPVIFLSALSNPEDKVKAFNVGGIDYIPKPFNDKEVIIRVQSHLQTSTIINSLNELVEKSFHEIYTPLSVIETGLEMQQLEHGTTEYIQSIKSAARLLNVFSDDMYYSIKKEIASFDPFWVELEPFLKREINYLKPIAKAKHIEFELDNQVDNPMIYINDTELRRVVLNILSNAIKYSYNDTSVKIKVVMNDDGYITLSVANRGRVLQDMDKIFKKLYQEDTGNFGLGIGLEIVSSICKKNKIKIDVESLNNITEFRFTYKEEKQ